MTDDRQKEIFARNLKTLIDEHDKTQKEVADALKVSPQLVNTWTQGKNIPRMGKIQALADYFNVPKSRLLEEQHGYYLNKYAEELAEFLHQSPEYRVLFDATRDIPPEDIQLVKELLDRFKKER